jgi:hypothetical protein
LLITVARICGRFHLDPVVVLGSTDDFELAVRQAAMRVVCEDERKANEESQRSSGGGRRPRRR